MLIHGWQASMVVVAPVRGMRSFRAPARATCNEARHATCFVTFSTFFHNVFEQVVYSRQDISGQSDTSTAPGAIRGANVEIVENCGNPGAAGGVRKPKRRETWAGTVAASAQAIVERSLRGATRSSLVSQALLRTLSMFGIFFTIRIL